MTTPQHDPIDALGEAYEKMFERAAEHFQHAEEKSLPLLHRLVDEARDEAISLKEITRDDANQVADYLKRDLSHANRYLAETGHELKDWLGFETSLVETGLLDLMLKAADPTIVNLNEFKESLEQLATRHTGEITAPGTLTCDQCGEQLHFHRISRVPPCPRCHGTAFHRQSR